jgi:hypothetical protein
MYLLIQTRLFRPFLLVLVVAVPLFSACEDKADDPSPSNPRQYTTLTYTLTPSGGGTPIKAEYRDKDGSGSGNASIGTLDLAPNTTYNASLTLFDETQTIAENISATIFNNSENYLFFFEPTPANLLTITRTDKDKNNREVGLTTRVVTTSTGTGSLTITLRRQAGTKDGTFAPGTTETVVTFPTTVR